MSVILDDFEGEKAEDGYSGWISLVINICSVKNQELPAVWRV